MEELLDYTERRTRAELAALPHGVYEAEGSSTTTATPTSRCACRRGSRSRADGVRFDTDRLRPAAARAGQLDLRDDVLGLRVRAQVPDRPGPAGQRRLLPPRLGARARRARSRTARWPAPVVGGWETQTRLVDVLFLALLPAFPERLPAGTKAMMCQAGFGSLDVEAGDATRASTTRSPAATAARLASDGPDAVQTHGQNTENAPVEETELNYPVRIDAARARRGLRGPGPLPRRARPAQGLPLRPARRPSRSSPTATAPGRGASSAAHAGARRRVRAHPRRRRDEALVEDDARPRPRRRDQRPHLRRRRLRRRPSERDPERVLRDVLRGQGQRRARARRSTGWRSPIGASTERRRRSCGQ